MTVTGKDGPPSLSDAARQLGVAVGDLNAGFGVVPIDPDHKLYAVEVDADRFAADQLGQPYKGPFSNPTIAPFGPPKNDDDRD
jgi:hypothetical protein